MLLPRLQKNRFHRQSTLEIPGSLQGSRSWAIQGSKYDARLGFCGEEEALFLVSKPTCCPVYCMLSEAMRAPPFC